jgi:Mor family transcriptional regulator
MTTLGNDISLTIQSILTATLCRELGVAETQAQQISGGIFCEIVEVLHGEQVYFNSSVLVERRNEQIRRDWKGNNLKELMHTHSLSRSQIYRILSEGGK